MPSLYFLVFLYIIAFAPLNAIWAQKTPSSSHQDTQQESSHTSKASNKSIYNLFQALQDVTQQHPLLQSKAFEIQGQEYAWQASQKLLAPQLNANFNLNNDLVTIADPLTMGQEREIETEQQKLELSVVQPFRWGSQLSVGLAHNLTETNNPFRNCVPGISSEQCYENRISLSLTQPLLRGAGSDVNLAEERWNEKAKKLVWQQSRTQINQLIMESIQTYVNVSLLQAQYDLEQNELAVIQKQMQQTQTQIELGVIAASELYTIQSAHAQRMQSALQVKRNLHQAQLTLEQLIGKALEQPLQLPSIPQLKIAMTLPKQTPNWPNLPTLSAIKTQIQQAQIRLLQAEDQQKPQLDLNLVWSQSGLGESIQEALEALPENKSRFYGFSVTFSQPLSSRNRLITQQNHSQMKALQAEYKRTKQRLQSEWKILQQASPALQKQLQWARKSVQSAQKSWQASKSKAQEGRGTQFEVLEMQNRMLQARFSVLSLQHDIFMNVIQKLNLTDQLLTTFGIELDLARLRTLKMD